MGALYIVSFWIMAQFQLSMSYLWAMVASNVVFFAADWMICYPVMLFTCSFESRMANHPGVVSKPAYEEWESNLFPCSAEASNEVNNPDTWAAAPPSGAAAPSGLELPIGHAVHGGLVDNLVGPPLPRSNAKQDSDDGWTAEAQKIVDGPKKEFPVLDYIPSADFYAKKPAPPARTDTASRIDSGPPNPLDNKQKKDEVPGPPANFKEWDGFNHPCYNIPGLARRRVMERLAWLSCSM